MILLASHSALADGRDAGEGRGVRREAEEDLGEQVVVFQHRRRRRHHLACSEITGRNVEGKQPPQCVSGGQDDLKRVRVRLAH